MTEKRQVEMRSQSSNDDRLLQALANQIKSPLMYIARAAELAKEDNDLSHLDGIGFTADTALRLIDSYLLSTQLVQGQRDLELEPVTVSSVLYDAAQHLETLAHEYHCDLELSLSGKYGPVMAHRQGLEAALVSLGYVFIEASAQQESKSKPVLKLAAHKSRNGIVTGVFANIDGLSSSVYARAGALFGRARQPLGEVTAGSGAGVFVADSIFNAMSSNLRLTHHDKMVGLAATLLPSNQLSLV